MGEQLPLGLVRFAGRVWRHTRSIPCHLHEAPQRRTVFALIVTFSCPVPSSVHDFASISYLSASFLAPFLPESSAACRIALPSYFYGVWSGLSGVWFIWRFWTLSFIEYLGLFS